MRKVSILSGIFCFMATLGFSTQGDDHVEFVCMRKHAATKTCHYNFKVDGAAYRYVDIGCKFKNRDEVVEQAQNGDIPLAKNWKIACQ